MSLLHTDMLFYAYKNTQQGKTEGSIYTLSTSTDSWGNCGRVSPRLDMPQMSRGNDLQLIRRSCICDLEMKGSDAVNYLVFFILLLHI